MQASIRSLAPFAAAPQCAQRHRRSPVARADSGAAQLGSGDDCCLLPDGWEEPPSQSKRDTMNLLLAATLTLPVAGMVGPYAASFMPPSSGGSGGPQAAKDRLGNDVRASAWLEEHGPGDRSLVQGLQGDATYLVVTESREIERFAINSICTHLGCVVPWNAAENKFICPCHGSQYDAQGKKVRGPAPLSLALAHTSVSDSDVVQLSPWTETDFRDGEAPWWA
ncbi:hypothetical protein COHA_003264 [Chlorella ohadii]|uniref:plastoquinol--plastocyanin reductase n=1 Tax=Chlorella ohadii TaxID=2649997 RepID=A0AAD5H6Y6_9CHLO|nr:hypothetical protein COHA_003264 [Chlorella ohadii]